MSSSVPPAMTVSPFAFGVDSCWRWVMLFSAEKVAAAITYSFMIALLIYAIVTMRKRAQLPQTPVFIAAFTWMMILSTLQIILDLGDYTTGMQSINQRLQTNPAGFCEHVPWRGATRILFNAQWALLAANVLVADGIFVFRCYMVWDRNETVIVPPILSMVATVLVTAVVPTGRIDQRVALGLGLVTNLMLLVLVVGRILWSTHIMAKTFRLPDSAKRNKAAVAIVIYSAVIYTATSLFVLISGSVGSGDNLVYFISAGAARHAVNIVPIFAVVKSGLARELESEKQSGGNAECTVGCD